LETVLLEKALLVMELAVISAPGTRSAQKRTVPKVTSPVNAA